jgi:hypothetical protein
MPKKIVTKQQLVEIINSELRKLVGEESCYIKPIHIEFLPLTNQEQCNWYCTGVMVSDGTTHHECTNALAKCVEKLAEEYNLSSPT